MLHALGEEEGVAQPVVPFRLRIGGPRAAANSVLCCDLESESTPCELATSRRALPDLGQKPVRGLSGQVKHFPGKQGKF